MSVQLETYTRPENPSPYLKSLFVYLDALKEWDADKIFPLFHEKAIIRILPLKMSRPQFNKTEYVEYFSRLMPLFAEFEATLHRVVEAGPTVVVHATTLGTSSTGTPYSNELMVVFEFEPVSSEDGDKLPKILLFQEFVDSATSIAWFTQERKKVAALKHASS